MKKQPIIIVTVFVAGILLFSQTASAGYLKDRQRLQKDRIQSGITSGQITPSEAQKLYRDQRQVRQLRRHFIADGDLSRRERNTLNKRMDWSSHRIYRYKHNQRRVKPLRYYDNALRHFARR